MLISNHSGAIGVSLSDPSGFMGSFRAALSSCFSSAGWTILNSWDRSSPYPDWYLTVQYETPTSSFAADTPLYDFRFRIANTTLSIHCRTGTSYIAPSEEYPEGFLANERAFYTYQPFYPYGSLGVDMYIFTDQDTITPYISCGPGWWNLFFAYEKYDQWDLPDSPIYSLKRVDQSMFSAFGSYLPRPLQELTMEGLSRYGFSGLASTDYLYRLPFITPHIDNSPAALYITTLTQGSPNYSVNGVNTYTEGGDYVMDELVVFSPTTHPDSVQFRPPVLPAIRVTGQHGGSPHYVLGDEFADAAGLLWKVISPLEIRGGIVYFFLWEDLNV